MVVSQYKSLNINLKLTQKNKSNVNTSFNIKIDRI